jgi:predicted dehydrogenase
VKEKPVLKIGFVGSGFAARFHFEAVSRVVSVQPEVVGVYSPTKAHRDKFAKVRDIRSYGDLEGLIADSDVVHVLSPPSSHEEIAIKVLSSGKHVVIEKPFTGYFGDGGADFNGLSCSKERAFEEAVASIERMLAAEAAGRGTIYYAENLVYAPAVRKEKEIIEKTGDQILFMFAETSHNGSASKFYGYWSFSGGGSLMGKGVHPLSTIIYLKYVEGRTIRGKPIRPISVTSRIHAVTRSPQYRGSKFIREDYHDIEDFGMMHVVFEDDTVADIVTSELVLGGVKNFLEVCATGHRSICNINPNTAMQTFVPEGSLFNDIYTVEKISTKEGWTLTSPDENWFHGYQHEVEEFYSNILNGQSPESGSLLAADTIAVVYAAYLSAERMGAEVSVPAFHQELV